MWREVNSVCVSSVLLKQEVVAIGKLAAKQCGSKTCRLLSLGVVATDGDQLKLLVSAKPGRFELSDRSAANKLIMVIKANAKNI